MRRMFLLTLVGAALVVWTAGSASSSGAAYSTLLQPNGKIVVGGSGMYGARGSFGLARYSAAGKLDTHFGLGGKAITPLGEGSQAAGVALQPDGKIVAAGFTFARAHTSSYSSSFALARYRTNGSVDRAFGKNGRVTTKFAHLSVATAVGVQPDGKIVAAGNENGGFVLARYQPNGRLDTSFGSGGHVLTAVGSGASASALALQADGKILVAGSAGGDVVVARYTGAGSLDQSFGSGGIVKTSFGGRAGGVAAIGLQADGKILVAGTIGTGVAGDPGYEFLLARYDTNGSLDPSFGLGGIVMTSFSSGTGDLPYGEVAGALVIQPDGKIVAGGEQLPGSDGARGNFALARYLPDGSLDPSFGAGGKVTTSFGYPPPANGDDGDVVTGLAVQPDGRIVAAGYSQFGPHTEQYAVALARYNADGSLDSSFGTAGKVKTSLAICVVPNLRGQRMDWDAQQRIKGSQCAVGKITRVHSRTVERRRVISETPRPGTVHLAGTKVRVVVSLGRR